MIECDGCQQMLARSRFDAAYVAIWRQGLSEPVLCRVCAGDKEKTLREDLELIYCHGPLCQQRVPEIHFEEVKLAEWRVKDLMHNAWCARCTVNGMKDSEIQTQIECQRCHVKKRLPEFPAVALKEWLAGLRNQFRWRCFECQFPRCRGPCKQRPLFPVPHNAIHEGYFCETCRFPKCEGGCGAERPQSTKYHVKNRAKWICDKCRGEQVKCRDCKVSKPLKDYSKTIQTHPRSHWRCLGCQFPECVGCGEKRDEKRETPFEGDASQYR